MCGTAVLSRKVVSPTEKPWINKNKLDTYETEARGSEWKNQQVYSSATQLRLILTQKNKETADCINYETD